MLAQLVAGRQVRQIAEEGSVSEATVRTQVKSVLSKLGVGSQLAAVSMAHRVGLARAAAPERQDAVRAEAYGGTAAG